MASTTISEVNNMSATELEVMEANIEQNTSAQQQRLIEDDFLSLETLDRSSPDLLPSTHNIDLKEICSIDDKLGTTWEVPVWEKNMNSEDLTLFHHYGSLTISALIVEVRKLYEKSYQLGIEEKKEITRGKYLNIFGRAAKKNNNM